MAIQAGCFAGPGVLRTPRALGKTCVGRWAGYDRGAVFGRAETVHWVNANELLKDDALHCLRDAACRAAAGLGHHDTDRACWQRWKSE